MKPCPSPKRLLLFFLAGLWCLFAQAAPPPGGNVDSLLDYAREHNPEYAAARFDAEAAGDRVTPAGALPDPSLRVELENITNTGSDARPNLLPGRVGDTKYTLLQPLPFWGKRDLKRQAAEADADQARGRAMSTWSDLAARIKEAYAQYYFVAANDKLSRENLDLMRRLEQVAQVRYAGALAPQQDVIRAQVEETGLSSELIAIDDEKRQLQAQINALVSRNALAPLAEPQSLRPLPAPARLDYASLLERLRAHNPQLFTEEAGIRSAQKNRDLAYRNRYPDFLLGVVPMQTGSQINSWGLMLEMNIPLQQASRRSQEREAEAMLSAARARKEATAKQVLSELSENLAGIEAARHTEALIDTGLLPQARLSFQAALAGYENGKLDFATLLDAQRQIRLARLSAIKAQTQAQARLAEIEKLLGEDL
ncbi:cobalt-zinc-cadmium resistance protein CzcC precursor [mine drainage metagenome]|uniref:Cobalt-zinc-cadmium resistance protein CzcC n=1 Tax=mine drainage metagenome TaxID=410659 RepID=A0A1J5RH14_9ZZZZ